VLLASRNAALYNVAFAQYFYFIRCIAQLSYCWYRVFGCPARLFRLVVHWRWCMHARWLGRCCAARLPRVLRAERECSAATGQSACGSAMVLLGGRVLKIRTVVVVAAIFALSYLSFARRPYLVVRTMYVYAPGFSRSEGRGRLISGRRGVENKGQICCVQKFDGCY
jgi:hypothetical protein